MKMGTTGFKVFLVIWSGQFVSLIGSGLTGFALSVWIYQKTGSVTNLSFVVLSLILPGVLMSPVAGILVDKWNRRTAMIVSDSGAAMSTMVIALLLYSQRLELWHIYITLAIGSTFGAFQWPAYSAATTLLVPKKHLGRAAGMVQTAEAVANIASPAIAGVLLITINIWGVIFIDFATFLFALTTLMIIRVPNAPPSPESEEKTSFLHQITFGMKYITSRHGLLGLLIFFALANFIGGFTNVLFTPLILSFASPAILGSILSIGGVGMLAGGLVMSAWGGPRKKIVGIIGFSVLSGIALALVGIRTNVVLITAAVFVLFFTLPVTNGCSQAIWQVKTAPAVQGRVFSVRRMIAMSMMPLSIITAGPLADSVFEPLMATGGPLSTSVGEIIGTGAGRGIGLMVIIAGILTILVSGLIYLYPRVRYLEDELPDMVTEDLVEESSDHRPK
jgi:MFS family permease